ncbi:MAG: hypothetical protein KY468_16600 [Armatimonadetes bacterium]|nr:hypothetical protein [Armatimonadota bacterium]
MLNLPPELEVRLHALVEKRGQNTSDCALGLLKSALEETRNIQESMPKVGKELVAYWQKHGVIGGWADREDIGDSVEYAHRLREAAQTRRRE